MFSFLGYSWQVGAWLAELSRIVSPKHKRIEHIG